MSSFFGNHLMESSSNLYDSWIFWRKNLAPAEVWTADFSLRSPLWWPLDHGARPGHWTNPLPAACNPKRRKKNRKKIWGTVLSVSQSKNRGQFFKNRPKNRSQKSICKTAGAVFYSWSIQRPLFSALSKNKNIFFIFIIFMVWLSNF